MIFTRPDSPYWYLWLETTSQKEKTDIRIGTTAAQRHDSEQLASDRYHQRMNQIAARLYRLPSATPAIRFAKYAETYKTDVIAHHRGAGREGELLKALVAFLGDDLVSSIDADRTRAYITHRKIKVSARTVNREVDLLKGMLRDAVPKYLNESPIVGLKRLKPEPPKRRLMTRTEERKILAKGDRQDRALIILGVDGLIRLGDLLDLQRSDRHGRWIYVAHPKGGEPYEVALSVRAAQALDRIPNDGPYYFAKFRVAKKPRDWPSSVRQRLEYLCQAAGVPYGKKAGGLTFHWATRRTGATRLIVERKAPIPAVQRQGNWKTADVLLQIYTEADKRAQLAMVRALPKRSRARRKSA